jgi:hypothetical protein
MMLYAYDPGSSSDLREQLDGTCESCDRFTDTVAIDQSLSEFSDSPEHHPKRISLQIIFRKTKS